MHVFILGTVWSRIPVYEDFPEYVCMRINRFIIDETTYSILKNTVCIYLFVLV